MMICHVKRNVSQTRRETTKMTFVFTIRPRVATFVEHHFGGTVGGKVALVAFLQRIRTLQLFLKIIDPFNIIINIYYGYIVYIANLRCASFFVSMVSFLAL